MTLINDCTKTNGMKLNAIKNGHVSFWDMKHRNNGDIR